MSVFGYNYPAGAEHDPSAPWNQPDDCEHCNGTGRQKTRAELRAEYEEDKADIARDDE